MTRRPSLTTLITAILPLVAASRCASTQTAPAGASKAVEPAAPAEAAKPAEAPAKAEDPQASATPRGDGGGEVFMKSDVKVVLPPEVTKLDKEGVDLLKQKKYAEGIDAFNRSLAIKPDNPRALANRGTALLVMRQPEKALADFQKALQIEPGLKSVLTNPIAASYLVKGQMQIEAGRFDEARKDFDQAIATDPKNPTPYSELAFLAFKKEDYSGCLAAAGKAIEVDPKYAQAYGNRAECQNALGKKKAALDDLNTAIKIDPNSGVLYLSRAKVLNGMGKGFEASKDAQRAVKLDPRLRPSAEPFLKDSPGLNTN